MAISGIETDFFFSTLRKSLFSGHLSAPQVAGLSAILEGWQRHAAKAGSGMRQRPAAACGEGLDGMVLVSLLYTGSRSRRDARSGAFLTELRFRAVTE